MDYDDYVNNSDDDHSHDYDNVDDAELNELIVVGCQAAVKYYIKYIEK
jgi:hypothetical protein